MLIVSLYHEQRLKCEVRRFYSFTELNSQPLVLQIWVGSESAEKQSATEPEQKQILQLHSMKEEIGKRGSASAENQPAVPEAEQEHIPQLHSKKETRKRGSASAKKQLAVPKRKGMKKPGARQGIRSGYHIFIKTECGRLRNCQSSRGQNVRQMANDAWNRLSEAEKQVQFPLY